MVSVVSLTISGLALVVSITALLLALRRGNLRMTRPVLVGFLYDLPEGGPKVFFRSMLYATGKRGHIVESLFLKVRRGESSRTFNFWMYGETKALLIGSGLRVGEDGVASNHHFLPPKDESTFSFFPGDYVIDVYARIVKRSATVRLSTVKLTLTESHAAVLRDHKRGILFTWEPEAQIYYAAVAPGAAGGPAPHFVR
jgi:hypothetical protein